MPQSSVSIISYDALGKTLVSRVHGFGSCTLRTIEKVHWSEFVSNDELCQRTGQPSILWNSAAFACSVTSFDSLITTPSLSSIISTHQLQTGGNLTINHVATGRMSSPRTSIRSVWHWRMFQCSGRTRCLSWAQHLPSMGFNRSKYILFVCLCVCNK